VVPEVEIGLPFDFPELLVLGFVGVEEQLGVLAGNDFVR
jgi:hypothetical protein